MRRKKSAKFQKLYKNLSRNIEEHLLSKRYKPSTLKQISKALHIPSSQIEIASKILNQLLKDGKIDLIKGYFAVKEEFFEGILNVHFRGFGFVEMKDPSIDFDEIFIPKHATAGAVDGDLVKVQILSREHKKGPSGKVVDILKRAKKNLAGIIFHIEGEKASVFCPSLGLSKKIEMSGTPKKHLRHGERISMEIISWGDEESPIETKFSHFIGHISNPAIDVKAAIVEFDLRDTFSKEVLKELSSLKDTVEKEDLKNRKDFTHLTTITIDPETAKDFDDALSLEKDSKGNSILGVHIADVAHYVKSDSVLDKEALLRGNSTYFPGVCVPMIPEKLSNGLCSLKADVIRLTASVLMTFDKQANLIDYEICRAYIKSRKRFTYEEASEILNGKKDPFAPLIKEMSRLCLSLKKIKSQRGSIDFCLPEISIRVDENGKPEKIEMHEYDLSHQMVEEFMLKANEVVATHLKDKKQLLIFRVHEQPLEESLKDFILLANAFGFKLPPKFAYKDVQKLLIKAKDTPHFRELTTAFIRSLKLARYSPENLGHFGLALENYCHFTSPIRRYADLVVQRILFNEDQCDSLTEIADGCSKTERKSMKAESSVILLKKLRLLEMFLKDDPTREYKATITKVKRFALYFEVSDFFFEGSIHISELEQDFFIFNPHSACLQGKRTKVRYKTGDAIVVQPTKVDLTCFLSKWQMII